MPPPMPNPAMRMTANPLRPVRRYRPGKAVAEEQSSDEEESENEEQEQQAIVPKKGPTKTTSQATKSKPSAVQEASEDEEGFFTEEEDKEEHGGVALPGVGRDVRDAGLGAPSVAGRVGASEDAHEDEEEEDSEEEEESSEEESSSDDEPQRKFLRPTFIRKTDRNTKGTNGASLISGASSGIVQDEAAEQEEARRKEMADLMIKDKLERDAAARAAGRKNWDDDDEIVGEDVVDDTDGVDPEAEYAAWKLRELKRLKRDREAIEAREREIEERERRNNLTKAERDAEDAERLAKQKADRDEGRGKAGFMQQYHHKGAFFQDDETAELLRKRDLMGANYVDQVQNREALPEYMQIRNMAKLGKKGRTRYKDLRGEDTGKWGDYAKENRRFGDSDQGIGTGMRGVDERFQPDRDGGRGKGPTGANASVIKDRRKRSPSPYGDREKRPRIDST